MRLYCPNGHVDISATHVDPEATVVCHICRAPLSALRPFADQPEDDEPLAEESV